jgi:predicted nucleotidyltransferase
VSRLLFTDQQPITLYDSNSNSFGAAMGTRMTKEDLLKFISSHKDEFRWTFGVRRIGLFGSCARGEMSEGSDIDIVVELDKPDLFYLIGIKQTLEEAFGRRVDVVRLRDTMNGSLRRRIQRDAVYV